MNYLKLKFESGNLDFNDFIVMAILIAILYGLTAMEYLQLSRGSLLFKNSEEKNLRKAAIWSFYGIISTIFAGCLADMNLSSLTEYPLVIIPLFFISKWAQFHIKGSKIVDPSLIEKNIRNILEKSIIKTLTNSGKGMNSEAIYNGLVINEDKYKEIEKIIKKSNPAIDLIVNQSGLRNIINPFIIKMEAV